MFDDVLAAGGRVKAVRAPGMGGLSRSQMDDLTELARQFGAKGLAHVAVDADGAVHSPIGKFLGDERTRAVAAAVAGLG